jgi:hypothetical protein
MAILVTVNCSDVSWHNITIISLYCNCKGEASTPVLPFYIIAALPDDGYNYKPKHVVVNVMNE